MSFQLNSSFQPTGDQPQAIEKLTKGVQSGEPHQVLLGVTGSGKTFTMASVIAATQKPTLVIAHNKTLAAQLYQEFRDFFPHNAVSYFVSYYDYYQPEAYIPSSDTYIEKEATINDEIDKLRLATTTNLLTRPDVIVVSSVSCIYNLGSPVEYGRYLLEIIEGELIARDVLMLQLANLQYERSDTDLRRGTFRIRGDVIQLWPAYDDIALRIDTLENKITKIDRIDPISGEVIPESDKAYIGEKLHQGTVDVSTPTSRLAGGSLRAKRFIIYPAKHYVINPITQAQALQQIENELATRIADLKAKNKIIEAYRLEQKVKYDIEMIREFGFVNGIENYSRHFDGRQPGQPPFSLLDYFAANAKQFNQSSFLTLIDESHITMPQIRGMYNGDRSRKETLVEYGFRLPSATDNRPLQLHEFLARTPQLIYVSATPNDWEVTQAETNVAEQLVRPTGLIDPTIELRPSQNQIEDLVIEIIRRKQQGQRALVTTLTKKMAEALTEYLNDPSKIRKLIRNFRTKHEEGSGEDLVANEDVRLTGHKLANPDQPIWSSDELPIATMPIGAIDSTYLSAVQLNQNERTKLLPLLEDDQALPKVAYLHSDVETLERSDILDELRRGTFDVLVGINLLREGLDLPEVSLVAILDADKEGFLRSATALIQTMGRAARHSDGHVLLYADRLTESMRKAISETYRRRRTQIQYNLERNITPISISKPIRERMTEKLPETENAYGTESKRTKKIIVQINKAEKIDLLALKPEELTPAERTQLAKKLRRPMTAAANAMDFELAALIRDTIRALEAVEAS